MTIKKTATTNEAELPAVKAAPVKKTNKTTSEAKAKTAPTAAATHKAPARKSAVPKSEIVRQPAFDESAHRAEIEQAAYLLWESRGYTHGQAHEDWISAVETVRARYQ